MCLCSHESVHCGYVIPRSIPEVVHTLVHCYTGIHSIYEQAPSAVNEKTATGNVFFFLIFVTCSVQCQCNGGSNCNIYIEIGGNVSAGLYTSGSGDTTSAFLLTECSAGNAVRVKVAGGGADVWGSYQNMKTSVFSGALMSLPLN